MGRGITTRIHGPGESLGSELDIIIGISSILSYLRGLSQVPWYNVRESEGQASTEISMKSLVPIKTVTLIGTDILSANQCKREGF